MNNAPVHPNHLTTRLSAAMICVCALFQISVCQSTSPASLDEYLRDRIKQLVIARINQSFNPDQKGTPSASSNSTSLVDKTSVGDLFGFGLNLAQFSQGVPDSLSSSSASVTTTAYALYASALGANPLDPAFYDANASLRRFSFTYGYDAADSAKNKAQLYGVKILFWNDRDASADVNKQRFGVITGRLVEAGKEFGQLLKSVQDYLFERSGESDLDDFINNKLTTQWASVKDKLSDQEIEYIDKFIESRLSVFETLYKEVSTAIDEIRNAPQASVSLSFKKQGQVTKQATVQLNVQYGLSRVLQFVANAAYEENKLDEGRIARGSRVGIDLDFSTVSLDPFRQKQPLSISFSAAGNWADITKPSYQYQIKIDLPAAKGLTLPLAFRWTRGDLLGNADFTGQLGFAFDVAKLISRE